MRGNPKNQARQIFRSINKIGKSRHAAKSAAMKAGASGTHAIAKQMGVHSIKTMQLYTKVVTDLLTWTRENHNIKDAAKIQSDHVEEWLQNKIADGVSYKTFTTYAAALEKMSVGLSQIQKAEYNWTPVIQQTREQARQYCSNNVKSRAYGNPQKIIDRLQDDHKTAAELQLYSGCRANEITKLTADNLTPVMNKIKLTNTKGGRVREVDVPPHIYNKVASRIKTQGSFHIDYNSYRNALKNAAYISCEPYHGTHGLRWSYAQNRYQELQKQGHSEKESCQQVSHELGHNRVGITFHYLQ